MPPFLHPGDENRDGRSTMSTEADLPGEHPPVEHVGLEPERTDPTSLVKAAMAGDRIASKVLVSRYTPLIHGVIGPYRLSRVDTEDVCQTVWMRLWQNLDRLRDLRALPGWIITTTRTESIKVATNNQRTVLVDPQNPVPAQAPEGDAGLLDELLLAERDDLVRKGLAELQPKHRDLLLLLLAEPRVSYQQISLRLGITVGSIGPTRARCIEKLRATPSVVSLIRVERDDAMLACA